jgi:hypothetical protein
MTTLINSKPPPEIEKQIAEPLAKLPPEYGLRSSIASGLMVS